MNPAFYVPSSTCQIPDLGTKFEELLGRRTEGTFIEVGAYDGESFSNTSCLAAKGWRGVYIEPVPEFALACALRHMPHLNVRVLPCAVGAENKFVALHLGGTLTTTSARQVAIYEQLPWARGNHQGATIIVPQVRLDVLLARGLFDGELDLLVVDVEGAENEVFASFDLAVWRPQVMIVEIEDEHPDLRRYPDVVARALALRKCITDHGYVEYYRDTINTIYRLPPI